MKKIWLEITENHIPKKDLLLLNHQILKMNHPQTGHYEIQVWHSEMAFDERFDLVQHIPNDIPTMELHKQYT